jgi:hypothetical protein
MLTEDTNNAINVEVVAEVLEAVTVGIVAMTRFILFAVCVQMFNAGCCTALSLWFAHVNTSPHPPAHVPQLHASNAQQAEW